MADAQLILEFGHIERIFKSLISRDTKKANELKNYISNLIVFLRTYKGYGTFQRKCTLLQVSIDLITAANNSSKEDEYALNIFLFHIFLFFFFFHSNTALSNATFAALI